MLRIVNAVSYNDQVRRLLDRQGSIAENDLIHLPIVSYAQHQTPNPGAAPEQTFHVVLGSNWQIEAFHKPFGRVNVALAGQFNQHHREPPINDCAAWRLAHEIGGIIEEIVAPTVMRFHPNEGWGGLSKKWHGQGQTSEPMIQRPDQAKATAFFDSLVGQQDRHFGNIRWDQANHHLGLFDHGFSFAVPGQRFNHSKFVEWRWNQGTEGLENWEEDALVQLRKSHDLHGLADFLRAERAQALESRAQRMLASGSILRLGEF